MKTNKEILQLYQSYVAITFVVKVDISGECPVLYTPIDDTTIEKTKEVMGCTGSHTYHSIFQGVSYGSASVCIDVIYSEFSIQKTAIVSPFNFLKWLPH